MWMIRRIMNMMSVSVRMMRKTNLMTVRFGFNGDRGGYNDDFEDDI